MGLPKGDGDSEGIVLRQQAITSTRWRGSARIAGHVGGAPGRSKQRCRRTGRLACQPRLIQRYLPAELGDCARSGPGWEREQPKFQAGEL